MARDEDYDDDIEDEEYDEDDENLGGALSSEFASAPWYLSSFAVHMVVFIILIAVWPARPIEEEPEIIMQAAIPEPPEEEVEEEPEPEIQPETPTEVTTDVEVTTEVQVETDIEMESEEVTEDPPRGDPSDFSDLDTDVNSPALMGIGARGGAGGGGGKFGSRSGSGKRGALRKGGGGKHTEDALDMALRWLATHQEVDGHWDCAKYEGGNADHAVTGLSMLAFLGAGNSTKFGKYKKNVAAAQQWIIGQQGADGHYGKFRYQAAMTLMAMAECYGMSEDYNIEASVQRAVDAACRAQNGDGGWRYSPGNMDINASVGGGGGGGKSDTSVAGWWMMGLKSAKTAGLKVPASTWDRAKQYFTSVGQSNGAYDAVGTYMVGNKVTPICTSAVMCCRQFLGYGQDDDIINGCATNLINQKVSPAKGFLPGTKTGQGDGSQNFYLWYYEALGFFQLGVKNEYWQKFNPLMQKELLTTQRKDGTFEQFKGSWDNNNGHNFHGGHQWGRVGQTAVGALMLEVYYRYANVHKKGK